MYRNHPAEQFRDLSDLLRQSSLRFSEKPLFLEKREGINKSITYSAFSADVNALGAELYARFSGTERVLLAAEGSRAWVTVYFAVACGGGTVIPIDPTASVSELAESARRTHADVIFCTRTVKNQLISELAESDLQSPSVFSIEDLSALAKSGRSRIEQGDRRFPDAIPDPNSPCTVLFESGTATGNSLGVMLSHRNLCFTVSQLCRMVNLTSDDVFLSVLPLHLIYSFLCGILAPITRGGSIAFSDGLQNLARDMREVRPTVAVCASLIPQAMHRKILTCLRESGLEKRFSALVKATNAIPNESLRATSKRHALTLVHESFGGKLRLLLSCGGTVSPETLVGLRGLGIHTVQALGLPESSSLLSINRDGFFRDGTAGHPLPDSILDLYGMQEDGIGEIRCKGDHVMLGYFESPAASAEVLRDGWLYTGILGYVDSDGFLHVVGKKQNVIPAPFGKQVFPEELEALLCATPYVREALVTGVLDPTRQIYDVVAILFPDIDRLRHTYGDNCSAEQIRAELRRAVEDVNSLTEPHKRISSFRIRRSEFPKTASRTIIRG